MNILLLLLVLLAIYLFFRWWRNTRAATIPNTPTADWSEWQARLKAHSLPCLKIDLLNQRPSAPRQSRFGGTPWWPRGREWPRDRAGKPLHLLAQINFSETEDKLPGHPHQGLLQFFIAAGDNWGMDFVDRRHPLDEYLVNPRNFCVIYHEQPDEDDPGQPPARRRGHRSGPALQWRIRPAPAAGRGYCHHPRLPLRQHHP